MYCTACGKELNEKAAICVNCGVPVDNKHNLAGQSLAGFYAIAVLIPLVGFILGIYVIFRDKVVHGVMLIMLSVLMGWFWTNLIFGYAAATGENYGY